MTMNGTDGLKFAPAVADVIREDSRRIVITGGGGWIGKALLVMLVDALGREESERRVIVYGSTSRTISLGSCGLFDQRALAEIDSLDARPTTLVHLAFLTKDKVGGMSGEDYRVANRALSERVFDAAQRIGVDRLFVASSGAAAFAEDAGAAEDLRLYGALKCEDEQAAQHWAEAAPDIRRALVVRLFSLSGPFINKPETYALASFILDALAGRPIQVKAEREVLRSYVAVSELLSLVFARLLGRDGPTFEQFDTGGETIELGDLAVLIDRLVGGAGVRRAPITNSEANRYVGSHSKYLEILAQSNIEHVAIERQILETTKYLRGDS